MEQQAKSKYELEQEENENIATQNIKKAKAVFKILGFTINEKKLQESQYYVEGTRESDKATFHFGNLRPRCGYDGKFEIRGDYSYDPGDCGAIKYGESRPIIGVSISKTPEQIAKDIERRFLPQYLEIETKCRAYKEAKETRLNNRDAACSKLGELVGRPWQPNSWKAKDTEQSVDFSETDGFKCGGRIESNDGDSFTVALCCVDFETVKALLNTLKA